MRGQSSIESLLVLAAVLSAVSGIVYVSVESFQGVDAISAAREGVENAITKFEIENGASIRVSGVSRSGDNLSVVLKYWGDLDNNSVQSEVRRGALNYIYRAFNGEYPGSGFDYDNGVSTSHHTFLLPINNIHCQKVRK